MDVAHQADWVYSTKSATLVRRISDKELIYHSEKSMPWPVWNRDVVMHLKIEQLTGGMMKVTASSVADKPTFKKA